MILFQQRHLGTHRHLRSRGELPAAAPIESVFFRIKSCSGSSTRVLLLSARTSVKTFTRDSAGRCPHGAPRFARIYPSILHPKPDAMAAFLILTDRPKRSTKSAECCTLAWFSERGSGQARICKRTCRGFGSRISEHILRVSYMHFPIFTCRDVIFGCVFKKISLTNLAEHIFRCDDPNPKRIFHNSGITVRNQTSTESDPD